MRTAEVTLPGFRHYICSAIHQLGADSPFFRTLPLYQHSLRYIYPPVAAALLRQSLAATAATLGKVVERYERLMKS